MRRRHCLGRWASAILPFAGNGWYLDTSLHECRRFSVLRGSLRHRSPKGLPGPLYVLRCVMVPMEARAALRARMPADRQALVDNHPTATTGLRSVRGIDGNDFPTGACCLEGKKGQECCPPYVLDRFSKMMVLDRIGCLEIFVIDRVIGSYERERRLLVYPGKHLDCLATPIAPLLPT